MERDFARLREKLAYYDRAAQFEYAKDKGDASSMSEIIRTMLTEGYSTREIIRATGLSREQVMVYRNQKAEIASFIEEVKARSEAFGVMKTAKSMLADGLDPARVARITGLPKKQIMALM